MTTSRRKNKSDSCLFCGKHISECSCGMSLPKQKMKVGERLLPTGQIETLECRLNFIGDLFGDNEIKQGIDEFTELREDVERFLHFVSGGGSR